MRVAIHQPNFAPWLGFFHKLLSVDRFVFFDDVMTPRGKSFVNRVRIRSQAQEAWLTVPVVGRSGQPLIKDLKISEDTSWQRKVLRTLEVSYRKAPFFEPHFESLRQIVTGSEQSVFLLNKAVIEWLMSLLNIETEIFLSSSLGLQEGLGGGEKILSILGVLDATTYLTGAGAGSRRYIVEADYRERGIALEWQSFDHPVYPQVGEGFFPRLSALDGLFCIGPQRLRELIEH